MTKKPIIQEHHITYCPDYTPAKCKTCQFPTCWKVTVYKGEHWILTQLSRRHRTSVGFLEALQHWVETVPEATIDL